MNAHIFVNNDMRFTWADNAIESTSCSSVGGIYFLRLGSRNRCEDVWENGERARKRRLRYGRVKSVKPDVRIGSGKRSCVSKAIRS